MHVSFMSPPSSYGPATEGTSLPFSSIMVGFCGGTGSRGERKKKHINNVRRYRRREFRSKLLYFSRIPYAISTCGKRFRKLRGNSCAPGQPAFVSISRRDTDRDVEEIVKAVSSIKCRSGREKRVFRYFFVGERADIGQFFSFIYISI